MAYRRFWCQILVVFYAIHAQASGAKTHTPYNDCLRPLLQVFANDPHIPDLDLSQAKQVHVFHQRQNVFEIPRGKFTDLHWKRVSEVVQWASKQMERRGWTGSFLKERLAIAKKYLSTSRYIVTRSATNDKYHVISGSMGMTMAEYQEGSKALENLPMEKSHGWRLGRPMGLQGKGKIIELRTYGMDKRFDSEPFAILWEGLNRMIKEEFADYPELLNEKVIYTYNDAEGARLYRPMGLSLADQKLYPPVFHKGTKWMVLQGSPNDVLNAMISRMEEYKIDGLTGPVRVKMGTGQKFIADGSRGVDLRKKMPVKFSFYEPSEIRNGIWAEKGSMARFYASGKIERIEQLAKDTLVPLHPARPAEVISAKLGTSIDFFENGSLRDVECTAKSIIIPGTQIRIPAGSRLRFSEAGGIEIIKSPTPIEVDPVRLPGVFAAADSYIYLGRHGLEFHSDKEAEVMAGLFARAKAKVVYKVNPEGELDLLQVSRIARDFTFKGRTFQAGAPFWSR